MSTTRLCIALAGTLCFSGLAACSSGGSTPGSDASRPAYTASPARAPTIAQPDTGDLRVAPDSKRIDLEAPIFSRPTELTNPLFPISSQESVLMVGRVDDQDFRTEVTLLDHTRVIPWNGQQVEVAVSQYVAFLDGRIQEVAYDLYAQDDAGNVWYFGEDVYNFTDGSIGDTHGTWIAGVDGPGAMIMPADPKPGDVYRPENIPGLVFEEVTISQTDVPFAGPFGPDEGALVVTELHMDGAKESKTFAPGYGEYFTSGGGDTEALALAVPTDRGDGQLPAPVGDLQTSADKAYDAAMSGDWFAAGAESADARAARASIAAADVPRLLRPLLARAVAQLDESVSSHQRVNTAQAAIDVARLAQDLRLRYEPVQVVDLARFDTWLAQMLLDAKNGDLESVRGDFFSIDYVRDRIRGVLDDSTRSELDLALEQLLDAVNEEEPEAITEVASELRSTLAEAGG